MPVRYGIGAVARNFVKLGNRWGATRGGNVILGLFNTAVPVTVIERWRDEHEGGVFGLTAFAAGIGTSIHTAAYTAQFPSVVFGSAESEWELLSARLAMHTIRGDTVLGYGDVTYDERIFLYSPFGGYNPVLNGLVGPFAPGLIAKEPFGFGSVFGFSGSNLFLPLQPEGLCLTDNSVRGISTVSGADRGDALLRSYISGANVKNAGHDLKLQGDAIRFSDPPLRIPRNHTLTFQRSSLPEDTTPFIIRRPPDLQVSITYRTLPDRRF